MILALLAIEIVLRLVGIYHPRMTQADPVLGVIHRPSMSYRYRQEGESFVQINSAGFRDEEWPIAKAKDELRIAVLGDSYTEAFQVPADSRFTEVLARMLGQSPALAGRSARVMNFGMSGYGTGQELLVLRDRVAKYQPDLVVLAFLTGNDLSDNSLSLRPHERRPFFFVQDGQLTLDESFQDWVASEERWPAVLRHKLADWSRIVQLYYQVRRAMQWRTVVAQARALGTAPPRELGLDDEIYQEPTTQPWRDAWELTERLLAAMDEETRAMGATLLVVTLSNSDQVEPDPDVRRQYLARLGVSDLFYPDERIRQFCEAHRIAVLTLAPTLAEYAAAHHEYLHGFENSKIGRGHWNALGHRLAGELIAVRIADMAAEGVFSAPPREGTDVAPSTAGEGEEPTP
ncbi:MAG: SGNH/GDSL hydrolase family protein [Planctomycetia bacterium]|nr:SGNH/GDSL hydrolase family protein [Planctomycetia bacterium]